jgi:hypothetical protein
LACGCRYRIGSDFVALAAQHDFDDLSTSRIVPSPFDRRVAPAVAAAVAAVAHV